MNAAIVGTGNIGTDLLIKLRRSKALRPRYFVGIDPGSAGLRLAGEIGIETSAEGVRWLLDQAELPDLVFEATSAKSHLENAELYKAAGVPVVDLTPAAVGPMVVPTVNGLDKLDAPNVNMVTCGGQATIPIVAAVSRVTDIDYAEIVASIASCSAGPGTRANIDEFTQTTAHAIETIGGARLGKAIIILNPAEPAMVMRDTVYCAIPAEADREAIAASITRMVEEVASFVPGYRLVNEPQFDEPRPEWNGRARVAVFVEVEGNGDFLPRYAGNLDIMTAAALRVGEMIAESRHESS